MKKARAYGKEEEDGIISGVINMGDYNYNCSALSEGKEKLVARRLNKWKIIQGKVSPNSGIVKLPITINNETSIEMLILTSLTVSNGKENIVKIYNYDLPEKVTGDMHVPCPGCLKSFKKNTLRRHKCPQKPLTTSGKDNYSVAESYDLIPDVYPLANERLRRLVLTPMQKGEIRDAVKSDEIIILFGNELVCFYTKYQDYSMISHQLRLLGELLLKIRKNAKKLMSFVIYCITSMPLQYVPLYKKWPIIMLHLEK